MPGQLWEPLPERPGGAWLPAAGFDVLVCAGVVEDAVALDPVDVLDVAAVAIAAPPPAIAAVATTVTSKGLSLSICSPPFGLTKADSARPASGPGRRRVRVG